MASLTFKSRLKMELGQHQFKLLPLPKILLQTVLVLVCLTSCLCQSSRIEEIFVDETSSQNLVRNPRDISQGSQDVVSNLAIHTK